MKDSMLKILWYPKGWKKIVNDPKRIFQSSNRMRVYNFHECLKLEKDVHSDVAGFTILNPTPFSYDIVIFEKHFDRFLARMLRNFGIGIVFDICDPIDLNQKITRECDIITTNSHELADYFKTYKPESPVLVLEDPYEGDINANKVHTNQEELIATWYGNYHNYYSFVRPLVGAITTLDFVYFQWAAADTPRNRKEQHFISGVELGMDWRKAWTSEKSWLSFIKNSDVGIVPVPKGEIKPAHKVLSYMAYGIPVICSPTDAYKRIVRHGENGFFAETEDQWRQALKILRDPSVRNKVGGQAKKDVAGKWSVEVVARRFLDIVKKAYNSDSRLLRNRDKIFWGLLKYKLYNRMHVLIRPFTINRFLQNFLHNCLTNR